MVPNTLRSCGTKERPSRLMSGAASPAIVAILEADVAAARPQQAGDQLEQGRLAGAVRPDQRDDLARLDGQRRAAHDLVGRRIAAAQVGDLEEAHAARRAEIGFAHAMVGAHGVERAFGQHLALGHHDHRIAELGDEAHVVLDQQHA